MNKEFIEKTLICLIKSMYNENIDFYIVGSIAGYIDAGIDIKRKHDDIDIMIKEKDIPKLKNIFKDSDYIFNDDRFYTNKYLNDKGYTEGEHELYAKHKTSNFHIGFFMYETSDNSYTIVEYFKDNNIQKRLNRTLPIEYFKYQYNDKVIYKGLKIKTARKELIYKNKLFMDREKDLIDVRNLKPYIDYNIFNKLKGLSKIRKVEIVEL